MVDGDTVDLSNGKRERCMGKDMPEKGECDFTCWRHLRAGVSFRCG